MNHLSPLKSQGLGGRIRNHFLHHTQPSDEGRELTKGEKYLERILISPHSITIKLISKDQEITEAEVPFYFPFLPTRLSSTEDSF
jgi:hypothetical protein